MSGLIKQVVVEINCAANSFFAMCVMNLLIQEHTC